MAVSYRFTEPPNCLIIGYKINVKGIILLHVTGYSKSRMWVKKQHISIEDRKPEKDDEVIRIGLVIEKGF